MRKYATSTEYARDLKERRKVAGLCIICGKTVDDNYTTCSVCRLHKNQQVKQNRDRKKIEDQRSKKRKNKMGIDEINAIARERGMSYGLYVALHEKI